MDSAGAQLQDSVLLEQTALSVIQIAKNAMGQTTVNVLCAKMMKAQYWMLKVINVYAAVAEVRL